MTKRAGFRLLIICNCLLLLGNIVWTAHLGNTKAAPESSHYPLLAKRIFIDNPNDIFINFVPLRQQVKERFSALNVPYSFYFEYLPDGTSIRQGDDKELTAASLIKLPLVMNLYRAVELKRISLDKEVVIGADAIDPAYGDLWKQGAGTKITLRKAVELTLTQSDNTAAHTIYDNISTLLKPDEEALAQLDIHQDMKEGQAVITARSFSSILKSLYFSSYLNRADSQEILQYLSKSSFRERLAKPLPGNIPVAHKIGVYNAQWSESDCGVVYVPKRPYIFCAMVGLPEDQANIFIANVSKDVYTFISQQKL
jgi:beta-lactamase class A